MASRNQGMNKLTKDQYGEMMDDVASVPRMEIHQERSDVTARNKHIKMVDEGRKPKVKTSKLVSYFKRARTEEQMTDIMSMTYGFDPESKLYEFQEEVGRMYDEVINGYIERECPETIFNTALYKNKRADFVEMIISTSKKGRDLRKLVDMYLTELNK